MVRECRDPSGDMLGNKKEFGHGHWMFLHMFPKQRYFETLELKEWNRTPWK